MKEQLLDNKNYNMRSADIFVLGKSVGILARKVENMFSLFL